uniref:Uncharacterized protein n=1 Tax=Oryza glumipatula TaxID=40148 RepID=A0A0D9Y843_9ORYZ
MFEELTLLEKGALLPVLNLLYTRLYNREHESLTKRCPAKAYAAACRTDCLRASRRHPPRGRPPPAAALSAAGAAASRPQALRPPLPSICSRMRRRG